MDKSKKKTDTVVNTDTDTKNKTKLCQSLRIEFWAQQQRTDLLTKENFAPNCDLHSLEGKSEKRTLAAAADAAAAACCHS